MKMNKAQRQGLTMAMENSCEELNLNERDRKLLRKISKYILTFSLNEYETEELRKELIGISMQAELRGESLEAAIGTDYEEFCNEMINALTEHEIPVRYKRLKVTGTLLMIGGIYNLMIAVLSLYLFVDMCSWGWEFVRAYYYRSWIYICYLLLITAATGALALYGGVKGRMKCGNPKAAEQCFKCGVVLLALHAGAVLWDVVTMVMWKTWGIAPTLQIIYVCSLVVIFTTLLLYTEAANKSRR